MGGIVKKVLIPALIVGATVFLVAATGGTGGPALIGALSAGIDAAIATAIISSIGLAAGFLTKPSQNLNTVFDRQQTRLNQAALGKWVFGKTNAPLDLVFEDKGSNRYVTQVLHLASHEINSVQELYINDAIAINAAGTVQAEWLNILRRFTNLGTAAQLALVMSNSAWPAAAKGQGLAHIGLEWDFKDGQDKISGGVPTRLTQITEGCKVYDPRLDSTAGGTGSHRANDQTTWQYNDGTTDIGENWALLVAFYLLGWKINGKLVIGMGIDPADIDMTQLIAAANVCEQIVDSKKRYKIGGVLQTDGNHQRILKEFESAIMGKIAKIGGKWYIWAPNDDLTSLETLTDDDLVADVPQVFRPAGPLQDRFNGARGRYVNPALQYQPEFYPDISESTAVTEDGREHVKEHDFAMIQDVSIAERVSRMMVRRSRFAGSFKYVYWFTAIRFQPFDVITINGRDTNNLDVSVRIINMSLSPSGIVVMELVEEDSSIYNTSDPLGTPLTHQDPNAFDPTAKIPLTGLVATPATLTGDAGTKTDAFDITWDTVGGLVRETEVQFTISSLAQWQNVPSSSRDFDNAIISPVEKGTNYDIRARHITITGVVGDWVTIVNQLAGSQGSTATSIVIVNAYLRKSTIPAQPITDDGQYDFDTNTLTPPSIAGGSADNWAISPTSAVLMQVELASVVGFDVDLASVQEFDVDKSGTTGANNPLYVTAGTFSVVGSSGIDTTVVWSPPALMVKDGVDGAAGVDARVVNLTIGTQGFAYDTNGDNPSPSSSVLTATALNTAGTVYYEFFLNDSSVQNTTTATYTYTPQAEYSNMPDKLEVQIREGGSTGTILARDQLTVVGLKAGTDGITIIVSNEAHSLPVTAAGVIDYAGSGTDIDAWEGTTQLPYGTATPGYTVSAAGANITPGAASTVSTYTRRYADHSSMLTDNASVTYTITVKNAAGVTSVFTKKQSLSKSKEGQTGATGATGDTGPVGATGPAGSDGSGANVVKLEASKYVINYSTAGAESDTINFTTTQQNISAPYYEFFVDGVSKQASSTTSTYTLADVDEPAIGASILVKVKVLEGSGGLLVATDTVSIYAVQDGSDNVLGFLTNQAHIVPAESDGTNYDLAGSGGTFKIFVGGTDKTTSSTFTGGTTQNGLTISIVSGTGVYSLSGANWTTNVEIFTLTATVPAAIAGTASDVVVTQDYSVAKSSAGDAGKSAVPNFGVGQIGGQADYLFTINAVNGGGANDGEIRVQGKIFNKPDGTAVTLAVSDIAIYTPFEGTDTGLFYLMFSATNAETRFGGTAGSWGAGSDTRFITVSYDTATSQWYARTNTLATKFAFTPIASDCIIAVGEKLSTTGGIDTLVVLLSGLAGVDAITSNLTNPAHVVQADNDGTNYSLTGSGGTHEVIEGDVSRTTSATHSVSGSATKNGLTISVNSNGVYSLSGASWTSDAEVFELRAVYGGVTLDKTYSISKSKAGADGGASSKVKLNTGYEFALKLGATSTIKYRFGLDGNEQVAKNGGTLSSIGAWKLTGAVGDYSVRATKLSGTFLSGTFDKWLLGSANSDWEVQDTTSAGVAVTGTMLIEIKLNSTDEPLTSRVLVLSAEWIT